MLDFLLPPHSGLQLDESWGKHKIDVLTYAMTLPGLRALNAAILGRQGGHLQLGRVITCHATRGAFDYLKKIGVPLQRCPKLHAKAILVPGLRKGAVGSFNITHSAFHSNYETVVRVTGSRYAALADAFDTVEGQSREFTLDDVGRTFPAEHLEDDHQAILEPELELHEFQEGLSKQLLNRLRRKPFKKGELLKLPTGAGKTLVAATVVKNFVERHPDKQVLWLCHRREVLDQARARVAAQIGSTNNNVVFQTRGKAHSTLDELSRRDLSLVVVDEAHLYHQRSKGYDTVERFRKGAIPLLGMTATPPNSDKNGFTSIWNHDRALGSDIDIDWLREQRYLAHLEPLEKKDTGLKFVFDHKRGRRLTEFDLAQKVKDFDHPDVNKKVVEAWKDFRNRGFRRCLAFAVSIKQCDVLRDIHFKGDSSVEVVHSDMPSGERRAILDWFKQQSNDDSPRMLISVLQLTEGVDIPRVDSLFLIRPTFSATLHDQMIGRGLRGPLAGGTDKCAVLDFTYSFKAKGGTVPEQVVSLQATDAEPSEAVPTEDDIEVTERDSDEADFLPIPKTVGEARRQRHGIFAGVYYHHVVQMLLEDRQIDADDPQVKAVVRSKFEDDTPFVPALGLFRRTGKSRLPSSSDAPKTGTGLRAWLEKLDAGGISLDTLAGVVGLSPGTIRQYQSRGSLPVTFVKRLRSLLS